MGFLRKALVVVVLLGAGAGLGSVLFVLVTPGEQRKQAILKEIPEKHPQHRDEAARTQELLLSTLREAAATQENVAWRKNWMVRGDGGGRSA